MILYILKSATCLALLLAFYHLVLEREKMHNFNRFYLLGSILFSFLAPLYIIYIDVAPLILKATPTTSFSYPTEIAPEIIIEKSIDYTLIFISMYSLISSILFIRFGKNLFHIIQKIRKNKQVKYQKAVLVLVDDAILPHTFWNYIFINKNDFENQKIEQELFTHELTHVTQKHTLDVLFLEFLQAIFWINPFFILLKKAVQLNHEFLADETVINQHKNTIQYQHLLLNKAAWKNDYYLASNLNYSLTKKRLKMMTTQSSRTKIWLKKLAVIPLLAGFIFLFAERVEAQEIIEIKEEPIETIVEQVFTNKGDKINTGFIELKGETHYFVNVNNDTKYYNRKGQLADNTGKILSNKKAKSSEVIPDNYITRTFYKNKVFCEFYDDKPSEKAKWQKLPNGDKIEIIEIIEDFKQKTEASKKQMKEYKSLFDEGKKHNIYKLKNIKKMQTIYSLMSEKQKNTVENISKVIPPPPPPKNNTSKIKETKKIEEIDELFKLSNIQKDSLYKYKKINSYYEATRNKKPHYVNSDEERKEILEGIFSELGSRYFNLSKEDKKKAKRPALPHDPYVKLRKNNKVFYKLRKDFTEEEKLLIPPPPPPPVPNATKEEIEKTKNAYEFWKKRTGNDFPPPPPPPVNKKQVYIEKSKKQLPSSFIRKANEKENFVFNSIALVKSEKESKLNDVDKKQLLLRKTIIQATTLKEKKFNFKIDGNESKINDVYKYILDNPLCELSTNKNEKNILTLNLDNFKEKKMSNDELQNVYSEVFKYIK